MKIKFEPEFHMNEGVHALSGLVWQYGEVKDIPDDERIRVSFCGQSIYVNLCDDLLSNPAYKLADSDSNPQFECSDCGAHTTEEGFSNPIDGSPVLFEIDGKRVCPKCFADHKNAIPIPQSDDDEHEPQISDEEDSNEVT
jgi:hypothetical protein